MKINKFNADKINTPAINLHDDILSTLQFNREEYTLTLSCEHDIFTENSWSGTTRYQVCYKNVLGFLMTACDYWGPSPHIFDFEYVEERYQQLYPILLRKGLLKDICSRGIQESDRIQKSDLFETKMTFTSGDELVVVCESIVIEK